MRELICYLWHSKFTHYLSRPVLITELFCKYPNRPNKTLTRQALIVTKSSEFSYVLARKQHDTSFLHFLYPFYYNYNDGVCFVVHRILLLSMESTIAQTAAFFGGRFASCCVRCKITWQIKMVTDTEDLQHPCYVYQDWGSSDMTTFKNTIS